VNEPSSTDLRIPIPISAPLSSIPVTTESHSFDAVLTQLFSMLFQKSVELHDFFNEVAPEPFHSALNDILEKKLVWEQVTQEQLSGMRDTVLDELGISELDEWLGTEGWIRKLFPKNLTEFEYTTSWSCSRCGKKFKSEPRKVEYLLCSLFGEAAGAASTARNWVILPSNAKPPDC